MKKLAKYFGLFILLVLAIFLLGPSVKYEKPLILDTQISTPIGLLESELAARESVIKDLKPDNQSVIVWANDSTKVQTEYCLVYLHGFSASQMEGHPVHRDFAKRYGMNLYLPRLEDHGRLDTNSFYTLTPDNYMQSAEDALDIAKILGKKVIVMACSSGGTLATILSAAGEKIDGLILYSPNIDIADPLSAALLYPWGKQISNIVMKGDRNHIQYDTSCTKYWNSVYHMNGVFALKRLIKDNMNPETFQKINCPVFLGYYYKDEVNQDHVVSVPRMLEFYDQLGTPAEKKYKVAFPNAGHHVISSQFASKSIEEVKNETFNWAEKTLQIKSLY
jgi:pimeloyl-ACP methyl ester carboxylesterase